MDWKLEEGRVYSTDVQGGLLAETTFERIDSCTVNIAHTYVIPALRGKGLAADMMVVVARHLREKGLKAVASCSYANLWLKRNKGSYQDIISGDEDSRGISCSINGKH